MKHFWDLRFGEPEYAYGKEPNAYFRSIIDTLKPGKLLVPGAGEGRDAVYAATLGWDVLAFDQSEAGKQKAFELAAEKGVQIRYEVTDVQDFITYEKFDAIVLIFFHLPPALRNCFHKSLYGLLKPGGHIMLEAFNPQQLKYNSGGPKDPDLLMTSERLSNDFSQFQVIDNFELRTELMEGTYHQGLAETVRFHAIKVP